MKSVSVLCNEVADYLNGSGFTREAQEIRRLGTQLAQADEQRKKEAADWLISMCDPKWLGDLNVQGINWTEWMNLLGALEKAVRASFKMRG